MPGSIGAGRRVFLLLVALVAMASFVFIPIAAIDALGASEAKIGRTASVDIVANDEGDSLSAGLFVPDEIEVKKKTTITWTNTDPLLRHTVTEG
ncbi:MAG: hypothetical protein MN733_23845, partial [Nitrososphaera sp.]|nr:hypothetical protein [Nitrososphaera sp.]